MLIFLYWSITWYINHTPGQATFSGIVIQHKMNLMVFLYICFTLLYFVFFVYLFVCFTGLCCILFVSLIWFWFFVFYLFGWVFGFFFFFFFWSFRKTRKEWEHEDRWLGRSEGSGRTWEREQIWSKYIIYIFILI